MTTFPIDEFKNIETPFYYYDMELLRLTLDEVKKQAGGSKVHYAVKANANPRILAAVREAGLGVDCVSGGEIVAALNAGFSGGDIMFAGVGKTDREIALALDANIHCFNVESLPELLNINEIAGTTDGNYFRATSNSKLKEVYEEIDKLEKTKLNVKEYSKRDEEYHWFALAAFLCVLLEVLLRNSVLKKIP